MTSILDSLLKSKCINHFFTKGDGRPDDVDGNAALQTLTMSIYVGTHFVACHDGQLRLGRVPAMASVTVNGGGTHSQHVQGTRLGVDSISFLENRKKRFTFKLHDTPRLTQMRAWLASRNFASCCCRDFAMHMWCHCIT